MITIEFRHPEVLKNQSTFLTEQGNSGDTTLKVADITGFTTDQLLLVGNYGSEKTEIVKTHAATAPTGNVITLAAGLKYSHIGKTRITVMDYDKIRIYRADSQNGTYEEIALLDIAVDEETTVYKDEWGDLDKWYKIRYENSISGEVSTFSSSLSAVGYEENSVVILLDKGQKMFSKYSERLIDRDTWLQWLNEGYRIMINRIKDLGFDWGVKKGTPISLIKGVEEYPLPSDFLAQRRIWIRYDSGQYRLAEKIDFSGYDPNYSYSGSSPRYFFRGNKIVVVPTPQAMAGDILIFYYYLPTPLVYDSDTIDENYIQKSNAFILVNYMLQKSLEMDKRFEEAAYFGQIFENQIDLMIKEMEKRYPEQPESLGEWGEGLDSSYPYF